MKKLSIIMSVFLALSLFGMKEEKTTYQQCKVFKSTHKNDSPIIDFLFLPEEKNKVVVAYASGVCVAFDADNKKKNKEIYEQILGFKIDTKDSIETYQDSQEFIDLRQINDCSGRALKNVFYHDNIFYAVTHPFPIDPEEIDKEIREKMSCVPTMSIQQVIYKFKNDKKGETRWKEEGQNWQFVNQIITHIDPKVRCIATASTLEDCYTLFSHQDGDLHQKYPRLDQRIKKCTFANYDGSLWWCAMVIESNPNLDTHSYIQNAILQGTLTSFEKFSKRDTQLLVISVPGWQELWKKTISNQSLDCGIQSLAFDKKGMNLAFLSNDTVYVHDSRFGQQIKKIEMPFSWPLFENITYDKDELVFFRKGKEGTMLYYPLRQNFEQVDTMPETIVSSKIVRFSKNRKIKAELQNSQLTMFKLYRNKVKQQSSQN